MLRSFRGGALGAVRALPGSGVWGGRRLRFDGGALDLRDEPQEFLLFFGGERGGHHVAFTCMERWEQFADDRSGGGGDVDEELAAVLGVRQAAYQASLFEV